MSFQSKDSVIIVSTGERGTVVMTDDRYKQAEVAFKDNSAAVYFFNNIRKVNA